ncbi:OLC1v1026629C1 [Oldenlandia corymbosa var. corymbosa]|uniref:CASP-like protein n=1 Tax=Oldenlandia corymbosa var. corymbosa TaxID=529605 RepID=A0AAV1C7J0_OLDCO|nr:OLC1v1026629C1 [Oldenlandia corymbosa var. corymbosa]
MKNLFGSPGKVSGLVLRLGQCFFAASSLGVMAAAPGFSTATTFCYLIASMCLQLLWSFGLACFDVHALRSKRDLHNNIFVSLFVVGDWVTSTLTLAAASSSAGVTVLLIKDTNACRMERKFSCDMFQVSVGLAFVSWFLLAISSYVMFWLAATA